MGAFDEPKVQLPSPVAVIDTKKLASAVALPVVGSIVIPAPVTVVETLPVIVPVTGVSVVVSPIGCETEVVPSTTLNVVPLFSGIDGSTLPMLTEPPVRVTS
jgi:hypothetical protein